VEEIALKVETKPPNWCLDPLAAAQKRDVHIDWIRRNVPPGLRIQTLLKTDLFEEAYGQDELLFSLPLDASLKIGCDFSAATATRAADVLRAAAPWMSVPFRLGKTLPRHKLLRILDRAGLELQSTGWLLHNPRFLSTLLFLMLRRLFGDRASPAIRWLLGAFSRFDSLPTRPLTGVFIAACARKPANVDPAASKFATSARRQYIRTNSFK
jgi:hypothetical protein